MLHSILDHLRCCAQCGNSWGKIQWLCAPCESRLYGKIDQRTRFLSAQITHHYLLQWAPGDDLSPLVYSLKGGGSLVTIADLVTHFSAPIHRGPVFYPSSGGKDHGFEMAQAFSHLYGGEPQPLFKQGSKKQALMSRENRKKREFIPHNQVISEALLVDDIVTTGGTVMGCWKALGQPSKMTVWSLFYRKSL